MIGERVQALDLAIDGLGEREGVEALAEGEQGRDLRPIMRRGGVHAVERSPRCIIASAAARADPFLAPQFDRREEEVLEQPETRSGRGH